MLHVEKKKVKKVRKKIILEAAAASVAVIFCLLVLFISTPEENKPIRKETGGVLMDRDVQEIRRIRITVRDRESWTAERNTDGKLTMKESIRNQNEKSSSEEWEIDDIFGNQIEDALAHLVYEDVLTEKKEDYENHLSDFGLEKPDIIAEVEYTDGTEMTLRIGDDTGLTDENIRFMIIDGDPRLYAVSGSLAEDLRVEQELLHPVEQPEIQENRIDYIVVRDKNGEIAAEWKLHGKITDEDAAEKWQLIYPVSYPADQDIMANLKKSAGNLRLGLYVDHKRKDILATYGLEDPTAEIEIHMAAGSTGFITEDGAYSVADHESESVRFLIGKKRNEMTDYCLFKDNIYTINHFTVAAFTETNPLATLARYPVTVGIENLRRIDIIRENGVTDYYELTYNGESDNQRESEVPNIICRKNGKEIDYVAFKAAYERMRVVNVSGLLPAGWIKGQTKTTYIFRTLSGIIHKVELSDFDTMHDAVTIDGQTQFYLIRGGMGEMP